jgi:hypothetical protein
VTVEADYGDGDGFVAVEGVNVDARSTGVGGITGGTCDNTGGDTDSSGQCTIIVDSDDTGVATVDASATVTVSGVPIDVATDGYGAHDISNEKTWVDAQISIAPSAVNEVGEDHTFTVTVEADHGDGDGFVAAPGVDVTAILSALSTTGTISGGTCATDPTDSAGKCTVVVSSDVAGQAIVDASATVDVDGVLIDVSSTGYGAATIDNVKTWVDAYITIGEDGLNKVGDPHTFTVNLFQDDGLATGGDGVDGWAPAPDGTFISVTLTDTLGAQNQISENTCDSPDGTVDGACTITFTSPTPGVVTGHAAVTFTVNTVSLTRATDGNAPNSDDAVKTFFGSAGLSTTQDWLPNDTATLTGDTNLTGTLTFQLYTGDNCGDTSGEAIDGQFYSVDVDDAASGSTFSTNNSTSFLEADSGSYSWLVTYDDDNLTDPDPTCETTTITIDDTP